MRTRIDDARAVSALLERAWRRRRQEARVRAWRVGAASALAIALALACVGLAYAAAPSTPQVFTCSTDSAGPYGCPDGAEMTWEAAGAASRFLLVCNTGGIAQGAGWEACDVGGDARQFVLFAAVGSRAVWADNPTYAWYPAAYFTVGGDEPGEPGACEEDTWECLDKSQFGAAWAAGFTCIGVFFALGKGVAVLLKMARTW